MLEIKGKNSGGKQPQSATLHTKQVFLFAFLEITENTWENKVPYKKFQYICQYISDINFYNDCRQLSGIAATFYKTPDRYFN